MTMFLVKVPSCDQSAHVVAEYVLDAEAWEVSSTEVEDRGYGPTFEEAVRNFAEKFEKRFA